MKRFRITVEPIHPVETGSECIWFEVDDQDDLIALASRMHNRFDLDQDNGRAFAVGLKIYSGVILRNRQREPFSLLRSAMSEMMKVIKKAANVAT